MIPACANGEVEGKPQRYDCVSYPSESIKRRRCGISPASTAFSSVLALTPSMWRTTSLRANSEISEDREVVGRANVQRPGAMSRAHGSRRVDRVELLRRPVCTAQTVRELNQP